jgi:hypothetical protein
VILVPARHCGPPGSANGGWLAGTLAELVGEGPATVTLRRPTPVDVPLDVETDADGTVRLLHEGAVLAEAVAASTGWLDGLALPEPVGHDAAADAEHRFVGHTSHAFPGCFVCGTARDPGDGIRLFTGAVADRTGTVAGVAHLEAVGLPADELVPVPWLWAALDCPTAWAHLGPGEALLLGRMTAEVSLRPRPGPLVAVARATGADGRKRFATSTLRTPDGVLVAAAEATWFAVAPTA